MIAADLVTVDPVVLAPALLPALGAVLVLVGDAVLPGRRSWQPLLGVVVLAVAAGTALATGLRSADDPMRTLCLPAPDGACLWTAGPTTGTLQAGILLATAAALALLHDGARGPRDTTVTTTLLLAAATGGAGVAASRDLGTWLVTLELATVPVVALVALRGTRTASHGALTLLVTSVTSFALLVLGAALWLTATGDASFAADTVAAAWADPERRAVLLLAVTVLLSGLGFKLSLVPFHAWTPQAYSTADLGTAAALAGASKISAVAALLVVGQALAGAAVDTGSVGVVLGTLAAASMLLGNVMALRQTESTRLLAWSTVSQAGWVVLPVAALSAQGLRASAAYVLVYAVATLVAFAAVAVVGAGSLERTRGLLRRDRLTGGALAFALLVLAGLPPGIIGLVAKVVALSPAVDAGLWPLALVAVVAVVLGIAVYLRWFAVLLGEPQPVEAADGRPGEAPPTRPGRRTAGRAPCWPSAPASSCCSACSRGCSSGCCRDGTNHPPTVVGADMHKHNNGLKTAALFGGMWALLLVMGWVIATWLGNSAFLLVFALIGVATTIYGYWNSDKLAIRAMHAYPVSEAEAPVMYRIVSELSTRAGQPMPKLYISPTQAPNAFATGRNPENAAVCCTEGILNLLDERELRGVLGHELMHVYNRDILTASVAAAVAGVISTVGQFLSFGMIFGGGSGDEDRNPIAGLALAILAPFAAMVVQLAISRTREYDADEDGATLTGDPLALASALRKLEIGVAQAPLAPTQKVVDASHMMIANPFRAQDVSRLMSTHPPMAERIARLEQMAYGYRTNP